MNAEAPQDLTVESALAELREIFPEKVIDVKHWHGGFQTRALDESTMYDYWDIMVYESMPSVYPQKWTGPTLSEVMNQVRTWHKEQQK